MMPVAGMLLVASPRLSDPNFIRTVVYLLDHGDNGTFGFVLNRPLEVPLRELWGEVPQQLADLRIAAEGGPVERHKGLLLHRCSDLSGAQPLSEGFALGGDLNALAERFAGGIDAHGPRLFLGHSGWAPGQLAAELEEGAWLLRTGLHSQLLNPQPVSTMWQQLLEGRSGGMPDPSRN